LPFGHYLLGLLLLDVNDYARAIPELENAQRAFDREPGVYFALGTAYARAGLKQEAARARATFLRLNQETGNQLKPTIDGQGPSGATQVTPSGETRARPR
jgi:predicted Zn-dependent protease